MKYAVHICPPNVPEAGPLRGTPRSSWPKEVAARVAACPHEPEHSYGPGNVMAAWDWWEQTNKHWKSTRCACDLFLIILPRRGSRAPKPADLAKWGYRSDGSWLCTKDGRRTPCRECIACTVIMAAAA